MKTKMAAEPRVIVIPKERAVFRMDANGRWHNEFGKFEKKKIIDYFNQAIGRDEYGYFVCQEKEDALEKVYFPYEDTALFVFNVLFREPLELVLNTGKKINLSPEKLWIENDHLYLTNGKDRIKFSERALMQISKLMEEDNDGKLILRLNKKNFPVKEKKHNS